MTPIGPVAGSANTSSFGLGANGQNLNYQVKRKEYEKVKAKLQTCTSSLRSPNIRRPTLAHLSFPPPFSATNDLGICRLSMRGYQVLECRKPFHSPAYMGRFDAPHSPCGSVRDFQITLPRISMWHTLGQGPTIDVFPDPGLNPIVDYQVSFNPVPESLIPTAHCQSSTALLTFAPVPNCVSLALSFKRRFRIQLELPAVHLQDLVERDSFGGAGVSIDLRTPR